MKKTKLVSFTLKLETIERLEKLVQKKSVNKSGFVDRVINQEIDREENRDGKNQKYNKGNIILNIRFS